MALAGQTIFETRHDQIFPALPGAQELVRVARFGEARRYAAGEAIARTGEVAPGFFVILTGKVAVNQGGEFGREQPIVTHGAGPISWASWRSFRAAPRWWMPTRGGRSRRIVLPPHRLRDVLVQEAELGERIMRALILRRVGLLRGGVSRPDPDRARRHARHAAAGEFSAPQRPSPPRAGFRHRRRCAKTLLERFNIAARTSAHRAVPGRPDSAQSQRKRTGALHRPAAADRSRHGLRHGDRGRRPRRAGRRGLCRVRRALHPGAGLPQLSAARRAPRRGSRIIWAFPPAFPAWR